MKLLIAGSPSSGFDVQDKVRTTASLELQESSSLEEALRLLETDLFDCVVTGAEWLTDPDRRLRDAVEKHQDPECHLILGIASNGAVPVEALNDGIDGCVNMPLRLDALQDLMHACRQLDDELLERRSELRQRDEEIATLVDISNIITSNLEFVPLLAGIARATSKVLNADRTTIFMYHPEREELEAAFAEGLASETIVIPVSLGISGHVATTRRLLNIEDAYQNPMFYDRIDQKTGYTTRSILSCPLISPKGDLIGVVECLNKQNGCFTGGDERILGMLAPLFAVSIENAILYRDLQDQVRQNERMTAEKIRSERLAVVGRMANSVTKDIADPMEEIVTHASHLGQTNLPEKERNATCRSIERIVDHLVDLAQELLDFSRDRLEVTRDRYTMDDLVDIMTGTFGSHGLADRVVIDPPPDRTHDLVIDAHKLSRAMTNVITALLEMADPPLRLALVPEAGGLVIAVSPLSTEAVDRFMYIQDNPFTGTEPEHGIGLKISATKRIIEAHGGEIVRDSEGLDIRIPSPTTGG